MKLLHALAVFILVASVFGSFPDAKEKVQNGIEDPELLNPYKRRTALLYFLIDDLEENVRKTEIACSGFYWKENLIITAASCFEGRNGTVTMSKVPLDYYTIWAVRSTHTPLHGVSQEEIRSKGRRVKRLYIHKMFAGGYYDANIAVVSLSKREPDVTLVPIKSPSKSDGVSVNLAGFGRDYESKSLARRLRLVKLLNRDFQWCKKNDISKSLNPIAMNSRYVTCSTPEIESQDTCGDLGSPLFNRNLEAIAMFGLRTGKCGESGTITWYTRLDVFKPDLYALKRHVNRGSAKEWTGKLFRVGNWMVIPGDAFSGKADQGDHGTRIHAKLRYKWKCRRRPKRCKK